MHHRFIPAGRSSAAKLALVALVGIALSTSTLPASATPPPTSQTVIVGGSIQTAIDSVAPGGVVTIAPGTYTEEISIKKSVTLKGDVGLVIIQQPAAATPNSIDSDGGKFIDIQFTSNVTLENLTLDGSVRVAANGPKATGVDANSVDGLTLNNVTVKGFAKNGIAIIGKQLLSSPKYSQNVSFNTVTAENNGWAGIAFYSHSSQGVDSDIPGVTFAGTTTVTGNANGIQFGDSGDTYGVYGANNGPVSLGVVAFSGNTTANVIRSDRSVVQLDRASTVDGRAVASGDFATGILTLVPAVSTTSTVSVSPSGSALTGAAVTVTGTVSPSAAVGTIEILDGTTSLGSGAANNGAFTVNTSTLTLGSHSLTATFTPANTGDYSASASAQVSITITVKPIPPVIVIPPVTTLPPVIPVVTPPTLTTPPPPPTTEAQVLSKIGSTSAELLARYSAANGGATPPPAAQVLTIAPGSEANANGTFDPTTKFIASVPWSSANGDQWVDVWAYSSPTYIGTFPVINGVLQITGANLSALNAGDHNLVFVGQTSGANQVVSMTMAEPAESNQPEPSATPTPGTGNAAVPGSEAAQVANWGWMIWLIAALVLLGVIVAAVTMVRRRHL